MKHHIWLFFFVFCLNIVSGQEVLVSPDINIRNDYSYDILPSINDKLVLFRNSGNAYYHETLNEDLELTQTSEIIFEKDRVNIYNILAMDTCYQITYGVAEKDSIQVKARRLNERAELIDSITLFAFERKIFHRYSYVHSEDESKTLLFSKNKKDKIELNVIDNKNMEIISRIKLDIPEIDIHADFRKIIVTNSGVVVILFDKDNFKYSRKKHKGNLVIAYPGNNEFSFIQLDYEGNLALDMNLVYDNQNNRIVLAGIYSIESNIIAEGYFLYNKRIDNLSKIEKLRYYPFEVEFVNEVINKKRKKKDKLSDLVLRDIELRNDGGVLLWFEIFKEITRRSTYKFARRTDDFGMDRGFVDYYNEDIILVNLNPDGEEYWKKVLHKKQFSQDDGAVFSSYFLFKTPSRIRVLYNDEVAKNSTISEYLIDPLGKKERRSLLNTEYEDLKLRFRDAQQISSNSMIVPSEKSYNLNLVKISY